MSGLTSMYLTLEIYLVSRRISAGCEVDCRHVQSVVGLPDTVHIANQLGVLFGLVLVPHHNGIVVMLEEGRE